MREILFRGKRIDNGEWVYGNLNYGTIEIESIKDSYYISDFDVNPWDKKFYLVIPESVGQYTGLTDKNGKKIFEGDVVHINCTLLYPQRSSVIVQKKIIDYKAKVMFSKGRFHLKAFDGIEYELSEDSGYREVIGNIYDNPELLEVTE